MLLTGTHQDLTYVLDRPGAENQHMPPFQASHTKAGKFDVVFDNNVRKLEDIQPLVQGLQALPSLVAYMTL